MYATSPSDLFSLICWHSDNSSMLPAKDSSAWLWVCGYASNLIVHNFWDRPRLPRSKVCTWRQYCNYWLGSFPSSDVWHTLHQHCAQCTSFLSLHTMTTDLYLQALTPCFHDKRCWTVGRTRGWELDVMGETLLMFCISWTSLGSQMSPVWRKILLSCRSSMTSVPDHWAIHCMPCWIEHQSKGQAAQGYMCHLKSLSEIDLRPPFASSFVFYMRPSKQLTRIDKCTISV